MRRVLFVCTGNIFRSLAAEHALRKLLPQDGRIAVGSAAIDRIIERSPALAARIEVLMERTKT
jgi:protein-tyrosine-phosphatase